MTTSATSSGASVTSPDGAKMEAFNNITTAVFDVLLAPFGHSFAAFDLVLWPIVAGIVALLVYKKCSNQKGIADAKRWILVNLLEVVLYRDDIGSVLRSTGRALAHNGRYLAYNVVPLLVMIVPMSVILVQMVSHFAYRPLEPGATRLLEVAIDPVSGAAPRDVSLETPPGVSVDAGPVRTADGRVVWRLRFERDGDIDLRLTAPGEEQVKAVAVGGAPRKVPVLRTKTWEALLYPAEPPLPSRSAFSSIRVGADSRDLGPFPSGEGGILLWFFGASLAAGLALKNRLGVTL